MTRDETLRQLVQKWRDAAVWEHDDMSNTQSAQTFDQCADELEAALGGQEASALVEAARRLRALSFAHGENSGVFYLRRVDRDAIVQAVLGTTPLPAPPQESKP